MAANPPFTAHGHDGRYGQVFRNVIDNALSFSPAGSRIVVELSRQPRGGPFVVTIDDEGPGIPEENLELIFQRFYSERPTEHFGQHSGLGLSICRQIMETYGGSISASNRRAPDHGHGDGRVLGARFTIRVPAADYASVSERVHATCVAFRWKRGLARRAAAGPSGSGKSDLALRLIDAGARLVADDQTELPPGDGARLIASSPPGLPA